LPHLAHRGQVARTEAEAALAERGKLESSSLRKVLEDQRKRVLDQAEKATEANLELFDTEERRQFESNRKEWRRWLENVEGDLQRDPGRILDFYRTASFRLEPIGLAYLWPASG
jgi:hypothetical protein